VGLTVDKSTLVEDLRTSITANETITGKYFPNQVIVSGPASVSFADCWFYGGTTNSLRNSGTGTMTVTNCEFGITAAEGYDESAHLVDASLSGRNIVCSESYFHHAQDFIRLGDNSSYTRCYMHHHVVTETSHADCIQSTGSVDWSVTECAVINDYAPDVDLGGEGINRAFHIAPDFLPISRFTIADNFIDGVGFYSFAVSPLVESGTVTGNRFGRGTASPVYPNTFGPAAAISHSDNRWLDTLESLDQEGTLVASGDILQSKLFTGDAATSASLAFDTTPDSGSLVVLLINIRSNPVADVTLPGEFTNSVTAQYSTGTTVFSHQMHLVSDGVDNSFSVSWVTAASYTMVLLEIEGPAASPLDVGNQSDSNFTASTTMTVPSVTTTAADTIVIAHIAARDSHGGLSSWANSYIEVVDSTGHPGASAPSGIGVAYLILSSTGSTSTQATAGTSRRWGATIAAYELSTAPATQDLTGTLHDVAPTFFSGTIAPGAVNLSGALLAVAPTFNTGAVAAGAVALVGTLFQAGPAFPQGVVSAGELALVGSLFQAPPTFGVGAITANYQLAGQLFQAGPTFPQGAVASLDQFLVGESFLVAPSFFAGALGGGDRPRRRNAVVTASRRSATL
jgi:hypothetical protein